MIDVIQIYGLLGCMNLRMRRDSVLGYGLDDRVRFSAGTYVFATTSRSTLMTVQLAIL
jgi:hypothetical protein